MNYAILSASALVLFGMGASVNKVVRSPYMDEVFHVPQAQKYCHGDYESWDHHITTFPGLYLMASTFSHLGKVFGMSPSEICSLEYLRMLNWPLAIVSWIYAYFLSKRWNAHMSSSGSVLGNVFVAMSVPFVLTFHTLFYTDSGSTAFVLATLYHIQYNKLASTVFAILSILFRQNNIIWVLFSVLWDAFPLVQGMFVSGQNRSFSQLTAILSNMIKKYWSFVILGVLFTLFVFLNGGIVVGDKEAHEPVFHAAQLAYLFFLCGTYCLLRIFVALFLSMFRGKEDMRYEVCFQTLPLLLVPFSGRNALTNVSSGRTYEYSNLKVGIFFFLSVVVAFLLHHFSYSHIYLLSDNRHVSFYVWQRFLGKYTWIRVLISPFYVYFGLLLYANLVHPVVAVSNYVAEDASESCTEREEKTGKITIRSRYWFICWFICSAIVLLPVQLLEFRYFSIPLILFLLRIPPVRPMTAIVIGCLNIIPYLALSYLFLFQPFVAPDGSTGRFIW